MPYYSITLTYGCGHTERRSVSARDVTDFSKRRKYELEKAPDRLCSRCYAEANPVVTDEMINAFYANHPEMQPYTVGSERQQFIGNKLRVARFDRMRKGMDEYVRGVLQGCDDLRESNPEAYAQLTVDLATQQDQYMYEASGPNPRFWLDSMTLNPEEMFSNYVNAVDGDNIQDPLGE